MTLTCSAPQRSVRYKGFIVIKKGGDAAVFKAGQAQAAGWPSPQLHDNVDEVYETGVCDPTNGPTRRPRQRVAVQLRNEAGSFSLFNSKRPAGSRRGAFVLGNDHEWTRMFDSKRTADYTDYAD